MIVVQNPTSSGAKIEVFFFFRFQRIQILFEVSVFMFFFSEVPLALILVRASISSEANTEVFFFFIFQNIQILSKISIFILIMYLLP